MRKIVMINGVSQGDALGGIGRSFEAPCNALGYEFVEINLANLDTASSDFNRAVLGHEIEFGFGFMGIGTDLSGTDPIGKSGNFWEMTSIPFLSFFGDSPAHFFDRHVSRGQNFASLYGFPEHLAFRKRLPQINSMVGRAPFTSLNILRRDELDFNRKASGQLIFLKNTHDPTTLRRNWTTWMRPRSLQALQEIASQLAMTLPGGAANQIDDVVTDYFLGRGIDIASLVKLRLLFVSYLDHYVRCLKAEMMAKALLDFPVQIRGTGWDHVDFSGRRASYINACNYNESRDLIRHSLGLIDMSPNTALAPHDRVLRAYGAYTLCLTNDQEFFRREVPHHEAFSFRFEPDAIQAKVSDVLVHPARYVDLGIETAEGFRNIYTPEAAIGRLIEVASLIRLNQMPTRPPGTPDYFVWPPASLA